MKKFRFVYWSNSIITEWYVSAKDKDEAIKKFNEQKGRKEIVNIELCQ